MADLNTKSFHIGDLKISLPIIQGGMGVGISLSGLSSAVSNEGGVGVISAAGIGMLNKGFSKGGIQANSLALKKEIRKARALTEGVLGVNIMVALSDFGELVKTSVEEGIDIIFAGAGLPLTLPSFLNKKSRTKLVPIVSSAKAVNVITKWWKEKYQYVPDAFVVEGPMAGGHLGFKKEQIFNSDFCLEKLVLDVLHEVAALEQEHKRRIPVIAAGGIFTGADIHKFLHLGASAVQMATRFVATEECDADIAFKNAYINCKEEDIGIIESPVGMPGRAITNDFINKSSMGEKHPKSCPYHCITTCKREESPYCISLALISACRGKLVNGFVFIGANGYRVEKIVKVHELINSLKQEYKEAASLAESGKELKL